MALGRSGCRPAGCCSRKPTSLPGCPWVSERRRAFPETRQQMLQYRWLVFSIKMFLVALQILLQQPYRLCHGTRSEEEDRRTTPYQKPITVLSDPFPADTHSHIEATDYHHTSGLKHPSENEPGASCCPHP